MQTNVARGEWLVQVEPALPTQRTRPGAERSVRARTSDRIALGVVLALALFAASVLGAVVVLVPSLYTPLF